MSASERDYTRSGVGRHVVSRTICCGHVGDCDSAVQANSITARFRTRLAFGFLEEPLLVTSARSGAPCLIRFLLLRYFAAMSTDAFVVSHSMFIVQPPPVFP